MYNDGVAPPGRLVAQHMANGLVLITDGTANSARWWSEGPVAKSLMIPHADGRAMVRRQSHRVVSLGGSRYHSDHTLVPLVL